MNQRQQVTFQDVFTSIQNVDSYVHTLLNEMQPLVFEIGIVYREKSEYFHFLAPSVHKVCDARKFSRNNIIQRCSADRKILIPTMIEEAEKVISKTMDFVYQDDLYIMQLLTNFAY